MDEPADVDEEVQNADLKSEDEQPGAENLDDAQKHDDVQQPDFPTGDMGIQNHDDTPGNENSDLPANQESASNNASTAQRGVGNSMKGSADQTQSLPREDSESSQNKDFLERQTADAANTSAQEGWVPPHW